jgi:phage shock protein PspC (stress-responsive transcriptional regulator)
MNKTVNINLGGMFFHIDEDAYQKLTRYFDAIKRSLSNSGGQDEIIKDIEMRIAELISEKHKHDKQVINMAELDEIIAVMGQPEDYRIEDDSENPAPTYPGKRSKKLYRDTEKGILGGVCSGLGHYFGIDKVWLRIIFVLFIVFGFGTGIVAYLVLWIVTPAALTTADKLEMTGEPVTISNIERKVREEYENVSERIKNADYDKMGKQVRTGASRVAGNAGDVLSSIFKVFAKVLGALISIFAAVSLIALVIAMFMLGSSTIIDVPWQHYAEAVNYTEWPLWILGLLGFLAIGIPLFFFLILGLKLMVDKLRSIGSIAKYTLLALWIVSIAILGTLAIKQAAELDEEGKSVQKEALAAKMADTLRVKFRFNDFYTKNLDYKREFWFIHDEAGKPKIYSNNVGVRFIKTDEKQAYVQVEKRGKGKSIDDARRRAEKIAYHYKIEGNTVILDNYFLIDPSNKFYGQEVEIFIYLPEGMYLKPDTSVQHYDWSDDWGQFNLHYSGDYLYQSRKDQIWCLDCPKRDTVLGDVVDGTDPDDTDETTSITIDGNGVKITKENNEEIHRELKGLELNEEGIIIKTK